MVDQTVKAEQPDLLELYQELKKKLEENSCKHVLVTCCPNCGYCPCCGRGGYQWSYSWPYYQPMTPTVICGTSQTDSPDMPNVSVTYTTGDVKNG